MVRIVKSFMSLAAFFISALYAGSLEDVKPRLPESEPFYQQSFIDHKKLGLQDREDVILERVEGLVLVGSESAFDPEGVRGVYGLAIKNLDLPGPFIDLEAVLDPIYLNKTLTLDRIREIRQAIIDFYSAYNRGLVLVIVPEQTIVDNTVQFVVIESRAGKISVQGNKWFSTTMLDKQLRLEQGESINVEILAQDIDWINRNPFIRSDVIMRPGQLEGTTDIEFWTYDRFPLRTYVGFENTGFESTGINRLLSGFNWGNAFGLGHILSYQYSVSTDFGRFYAHTASYTMPLPWRNIWSFFGGYSKVHPKMPITFGDNFDNNGVNWQVSTRYTIPFPRAQSTLQEITLGVDYKWADNNLIFGDAIIFGGTAVITQMAAEYVINQKLAYWRWLLDVELYWSPGDLFAFQSNQDYNSLRPGASSNYVYGKYNFMPIIFLPKDWSIAMRHSLQLSNRNLLASEQFGLGGYDTVRGYDQRDINTDNGILLTGEIRTPPMQLLTHGKKDVLSDEIQFLFFYDYGLGWNNSRLPGAPKSFYLMSVGPGLRYNWGSYVTGRLDWGIKLKEVDFTGDTSFSVLHFAVTLSY